MSVWASQLVAYDKPYPPPTPKEKRKKGNVYENLTPIVLYDVTLVHENKEWVFIG